VGILRDQIEMKVLVNVAEEWKGCREDENANRRSHADQQDQDGLIPTREYFGFAENAHDRQI
jgi:hypothetical protein